MISPFRSPAAIYGIVVVGILVSTIAATPIADLSTQSSNHSSLAIPDANLQRRDNANIATFLQKIKQEDSFPKDTSAPIDIDPYRKADMKLHFWRRRLTFTFVDHKRGTTITAECPLGAADKNTEKNKNAKKWYQDYDCTIKGETKQPARVRISTFREGLPLLQSATLQNDAFNAFDTIARKNENENIGNKNSQGFIEPVRAFSTVESKTLGKLGFSAKAGVVLYEQRATENIDRRQLTDNNYELAIAFWKALAKMSRLKPPIYPLNLAPQNVFKAEAGVFKFDRNAEDDEHHVWLTNFFPATTAAVLSGYVGYGNYAAPDVVRGSKKWNVKKVMMAEAAYVTIQLASGPVSFDGPVKRMWTAVSGAPEPLGQLEVKDILKEKGVRSPDFAALLAKALGSDVEDFGPLDFLTELAKIGAKGFYSGS